MSRAVAEQLIGRIRLRMIPVLADNFIYLLDDGEQAVLIDAGEAAPVLEIVRAESLALLQVLITHDHADHTEGCRTLQDELGVLARSPGVSERDEEWLGSRCKVVSTPGHTKVHKSFYFPELGLVFTGDALINGACGRLLGGTAEELHGSLRWLAALPDETRVFGGHDYLLENLRFAEATEFSVAAVERRRVQYGVDPMGALFATVAEERETNPFLNCASAAEFAALRAWKDCF